MNTSLAFSSARGLLVATALAAVLLPAASSGARPIAEETASVGSEAEPLQSCTNQPSYWYLTCNTTGWQLNDSSRMLQIDQAGVGITYNVNQSWMVNDGESCSIVETHTLNNWDACSKSWGVATSPFVVPASQQLATGIQSFKVKYPELGTYTARVFLHGQPTLAIARQN